MRAFEKRGEERLPILEHHHGIGGRHIALWGPVGGFGEALPHRIASIPDMNHSVFHPIAYLRKTRASDRKSKTSFLGETNE